MLYDEKLLDYKESIKDFETMNERFPSNSFEPEVMYRLFKMYQFRKDSARANYIRANLLTKYPESPYALILQHKSLKSAENDANKELVAHYEKMYEAYLTGNYQQVKAMKLEADKKFPGNSLRPKLDLLNALAIGKTDSLSKFRAELELVVKDYPKTDVAERAASILAYIQKKEVSTKKDSTGALVAVALPDFEMEPAGPHYFIFATKETNFDNNELLAGFNKYNDEFSSLDNLRVNNYVSQEGYQMVMVREFADMKKAMDYVKGIQTLDIIKNQLKFTGKYLSFVISTNNFKKMLKEQKVDSYTKFYQDYTIKNAPKQ